MYDVSLDADLQTIKGQSIYFGHQSVGENLIDGLKDLAARDGRALRFARFQGWMLPPEGTFSDAFIAENGHPSEKCDLFCRHVERLAAGSLDIAAMKFCYADFDQHTNVAELFNHYQKTINRLHAEFPKLTIVHVTVPLTVQPEPLKIWAKRMLGRGGEDELANLNRAEFNSLLLQHYASDSVFDLARIESTFPDGARSTFQYHGRTGFTLVPDYSLDGGHLNELGRRVAAREFLRVLAKAARKRDSVQPRAGSLRGTAAGDLR